MLLLIDKLVGNRPTPIVDILTQQNVVASLQFGQFPTPSLSADCLVVQATAQLRGTGRYDDNRPAYKYLYSKGDIMGVKIMGKELTKEESLTKKAKKDADAAKVQQTAAAQKAVEAAEAAAVSKKTTTKKTTKKSTKKSL